MAINSTISMPEQVKTDFDTAAYFGYRAKNRFRMAGVDVRWQPGEKGGSTVTFTKTNPLAANTAVLPETVDITPSSLGNTTVSVTINEHGDAVQTSEKLRITNLQDVQNLITMHEVGASMGEALDILCRTQGFDLASNITWAVGTTDDTVAAGATGRITASVASRQAVFLDNASVPTLGGDAYLAMIHGSVAFDLMGETGGRGWRDSRTYTNPQDLYTGELGEFEKVRYVNNSRCKINTAATSADVYTTYFWGAQAIAEAVGLEPEIRLTGPNDTLARFLNTGWYGVIGWNVFRQEALRHVRSNSSLGARP